MCSNQVSIKPCIHLFCQNVEKVAQNYDQFAFSFLKWSKMFGLIGLRQANLVLIAYASSEGSGEPAHPRSLTRTSAARSYKQ